LPRRGHCGRPDGRPLDHGLDAAAAAQDDKDVLLERPLEGNWRLQLDMR
jgi:hypothetical protein